MSTRETAAEARFQCRHILAAGHRCRAACLRHEEFCYYHHAARKPAAAPAARKGRRAVFTLPRIEDRASILSAINDILALMAANDIDPRRAGRCLYALQIAAASMPRPAALRPLEGDADDQVEEVVHHPTHGEIAPRTELTPPAPPPEHKSLARQLREEMEALEAHNIAMYGDEYDVSAEAHAAQPASPIPIPLNDIQAELQATRAELDSRQDRIRGMHTDLAKHREDLAHAKSRAAEARADTLHAEKVMVEMHVSLCEARAELESLKAATQPDAPTKSQPQPDARTESQPQPETLNRLQAVAQSRPRQRSVIHLHAAAQSRPRHRSVILSEAQRSRRTCFLSEPCKRCHPERSEAQRSRRTCFLSLNLVKGVILSGASRSFFARRRSRRTCGCPAACPIHRSQQTAASSHRSRPAILGPTKLEEAAAVHVRNHLPRNSSRRNHRIRRILRRPPLAI